MDPNEKKDNWPYWGKNNTRGGDDRTEIGCPIPVKVVGIGGAGANTVTTIYMNDMNWTEFQRTNRPDGPEFCCVDTDAVHLQLLPVDTKIQVGREIAPVAVAACIPEMNDNTGQERKIIRFLQGGEVAVLVAGLGGCTGSGMSKRIARISRKLQIMTVGIFIMPFECEADSRKKMAQETLDELTPVCDILFCIRNDALLHQRHMPTLNAGFRSTAIMTSGVIESILQMVRFLRSQEAAFVPNTDIDDWQESKHPVQTG